MFYVFYEYGSKRRETYEAGLLEFEDFAMVEIEVKSLYEKYADARTTVIEGEEREVTL